MSSTNKPITAAAAVTWHADVLGNQFQSAEIDLGSDPDGEGEVVATVIRRVRSASDPAVRGAMLSLHGMSDYFFHAHYADFCARSGLAFYALDLRKCGRSRRAGHTPHYVSSLSLYEQELDCAVEIIENDLSADGYPETPLIVSGHSTGALVSALWLYHRQNRGPLDPVVGLVVNSPFVDLGLPDKQKPLVHAAIAAVSKLAPKWRLPLPASPSYGHSMHRSAHGEWEYDLSLKPHGGVGLRAGWLAAVRAAHRRVALGLNLRIPVLQLRSTRSSSGSSKDPDTDLVLDVETMERLLPYISSQCTDVPIAHARHDVFLSREQPMTEAFSALASWIEGIIPSNPQHMIC